MNTKNFMTNMLCHALKTCLFAKGNIPVSIEDNFIFSIL